MVGRVLKIAEVVGETSVGVGMTRMMGINAYDELEIFIFDGNKNIKTYMNMTTMMSMIFDDDFINVFSMKKNTVNNIMRIDRETMDVLYSTAGVYKKDGRLYAYVESGSVCETVELNIEIPHMKTCSAFMPHTVYTVYDDHALPDLRIDEYYFAQHELKLVYDGARWININSNLRRDMLKI